MKIEVTDAVTHKTNEHYLCVLAQFEAGDKHYFANKNNWLPKNVEILALHQLMLTIDPDYREMIRKCTITKNLINGD